MTIGVEDRLEDAIRQATQAMVALLQQRLGVSYVEAITLGRRIGGHPSRSGVEVWRQGVRLCRPRSVLE